MKEVGIPCESATCSHRSAATGLCRLVEPVGRDRIHWLFALPDCPIASATADAVRIADVDGRLVQKESQVLPEDQYREHALAIHTAGDAGDLLDAVIESLRAGGDLTGVADRVRPHVDALEPRPSPNRRAGGISPVSAACLALLALAIFAWAVPDREPPIEPRLTAVTPTTDLRALAADSTFHLDVAIEGSLYFAVFWLPEEGAPSRIFPTFGPPREFDWPVRGLDGPKTVRVPEQPSGFRAPREDRGLLFILPDATRAPTNPQRLPGLGADAGALREVYPDAIILEVRVNR